MTGMTPHLVASLTSTADAVVDDVLLRGSHGMRARPRTEVGFVAAITLGGVPGIASAWTPLLTSHGYSLKIDGVFCHAAPIVSFRGARGLTARCELADLLLVVDHFDAKGQLTRRASLIQAKMASKAARVSLNGNSSVRQLDLYQNWPPFSFVEVIYGTKPYGLKTVGTGDAGSFGIIDRHFRNSVESPPRWTQHAASPTPVDITTEPTFGGFVAHMLGASARGCGRVAVPGGTDDWSQVVDLLLKVTYEKAFRHGPTLGGSAPPRGTTAFVFRAAALLEKSGTSRRSARDWRPPFDGFEVFEDGEPGGISILRLEISRDG